MINSTVLERRLGKMELSTKEIIIWGKNMEKVK